MEKEKIINEILEKEWKYFSNLNNIGGRADCQDNREDFIIMRNSFNRKWGNLFYTFTNYFRIRKRI